MSIVEEHSLRCKPSKASRLVAWSPGEEKALESELRQAQRLKRLEKSRLVFRDRENRNLSASRAQIAAIEALREMRECEERRDEAFRRQEHFAALAEARRLSHGEAHRLADVASGDHAERLKRARKRADSQRAEAHRRSNAVAKTMRAQPSPDAAARRVQESARKVAEDCRARAAACRRREKDAPPPPPPKLPVVYNVGGVVEAVSPGLFEKGTARVQASVEKHRANAAAAAAAATAALDAAERVSRAGGASLAAEAAALAAAERLRVAAADAVKNEASADRRGRAALKRHAVSQAASRANRDIENHTKRASALAKRHAARRVADALAADRKTRALKRVQQKDHEALKQQAAAGERIVENAATAAYWAAISKFEDQQTEAPKREEDDADLVVQMPPVPEEQPQIRGGPSPEPESAPLSMSSPSPVSETVVEPQTSATIRSPSPLLEVPRQEPPVRTSSPVAATAPIVLGDHHSPIIDEDRASTTPLLPMRPDEGISLSQVAVAPDSVADDGSVLSEVLESIGREEPNETPPPPLSPEPFKVKTDNVSMQQPTADLASTREEKVRGAKETSATQEEQSTNRRLDLEIVESPSKDRQVDAWTMTANAETVAEDVDVDFSSTKPFDASLERGGASVASSTSSLGDLLRNLRDANDQILEESMGPTGEVDREEEMDEDSVDDDDSVDQTLAAAQRILESFASSSPTSSSSSETESGEDSALDDVLRRLDELAASLRAQNLPFDPRGDLLAEQRRELQRLRKMDEDDDDLLTTSTDELLDQVRDQSEESLPSLSRRTPSFSSSIDTLLAQVVEDDEESDDEDDDATETTTDVAEILAAVLQQTSS